MQPSTGSSARVMRLLSSLARNTAPQSDLAGPPHVAERHQHCQRLAHLGGCGRYKLRPRVLSIHRPVT